MKRSMHLAPRGAFIAALASLLLVASGGVASAGSFPPDKQTGGSIGHYYFNSPGTTCVYETAHPQRIQKFIIKPPNAWWPDQVAGNHHEHGKIDWWAKLQQSVIDPQDWHTVFTTSKQTKTAYENSADLYGPDTQAKFTNKTITWHSSHQLYFRVIIYAHWHGMGTLKHWVEQYKLSGGQSGTILFGCPNRFTPA